MPYPSGPAAKTLADRLAEPLKRGIAREVVALFNDTCRGEKPVQRRPDGLFGPHSVAWKVHGDVMSMMVGGMTGLMLQMLHPAVLAGVWDHSNFRNDMHGRLRRTARFIALTTYGGADEAQAIIARVRAIHTRVTGTLADGTPYDATDPALLAWVHVTETSGFLRAWIRYADPDMALYRQDQYFREMAAIGEALGADPIPRSRAEAEALISATRPVLRCDARTREVARLLLNQRGHSALAESMQRLTVRASVDLLPPWARRLHGLPDAGLGRPLVRVGTTGMARTMRWVFS